MMQGTLRANRRLARQGTTSPTTAAPRTLRKATRSWTRQLAGRCTRVHLAQSRRTGTVGAWLVLLFTVSFTPPLGAQAPDATRDEEARRVFQAGQLAYEDSRYLEALSYFERAYELSARPELLFNIGQTADRLRNDERAIAAFERYVELLPNAENRRQVDVRLEILRTRSTPDAPVPTVQRQHQLLEGPSPAAREERPRSRWWIGVVVGVVVAAAVGVGIVAARDGRTEEPLAGDVGPGGIVFTLRSPR